MVRVLRFSACLALASAAQLAWPGSGQAHVGHGDEFQQLGDVRQVKANADTDALLGVLTEKPLQGPDGLTVPSAAVVEADRKALVFVKTATTYDPVFVQTGAIQGDRVVILNGVSAGEDVVVQGALSLYAESKKSQKAASASPAPTPAVSPTPPKPASAPVVRSMLPVPVVALGAAGIGVMALGGVALSRRGNRS
ncbi:MAG: hypothetical protein VKO19_01455 [Cyanobacteriota bacterium]|nr:hypothetical protein [Cyanobacteriota bacterium]